MAHFKSTFKLTVMTPDALIYENEVQSVSITGDHGEYELLPYHYPVLGILKEGDIIIEWRESISVKAGVLRFFANDCIILIEQKESARTRKLFKKEEDIVISDEKEINRV